MSVPIPGDFSCTQLQTISLAVERVFSKGGASLQANRISNVPAIKQLVDTQTANFSPITGSKTVDMKVTWAQFDCEPAIEDCSDDRCNITGEKPASMCKEYKIENCLSVEGFSLFDEDFRDNELYMDQLIAPGIANMLVSIENALNKKTEEFLRDNAGINKYNKLFTVSGDTTYIPAAQWSGDLMAKLQTVFLYNQLSSGNLLGTDSLFTLWQGAALNAGTQNGAAEFAKLNYFGTPAFDLRDLDTILGGDGLITYDPNAVAFVSKVDYAGFGPGVRLPSATGIQTRYTMTLPNLGIPVDIIYQMVCQGKGYVHTWKPFLNYDFFLNPQGCNTDLTGILKFMCGNA